MLTKEEFKINLILYKILATLYAFPIKIDTSTGKIQIETNSKKRRISYIINLLAFIRLVDFVGVLLISPEIRQRSSLERFILHFVNVVTLTYGVTSYAIQFGVKPGVTVAIFNTFFADERSRGFDTGRQGKKVRKNIIQYSVQELAALGCLVLFMTSNVLICLFVSLLRMKMHLYNRLPTEMQTHFGYVVLLSIEVCFAIFWSAVATFNVNMQLLFFEKITNVLNHRIKTLRDFNYNQARGFHILEEYGQCHQLNLYLLLFNTACAKLIFGLKCLCMSCTILCGYYTILNFHEKPILACLFGLLTFNSIVAFAVIYDKAFAIPVTVYERIVVKLLMEYSGQVH